MFLTRRSYYAAVVATAMILLTGRVTAEAQLIRHQNYNALTVSSSLPSNNLIIAPEWKETGKGNQFGFDLQIQKQLSDNFWIALNSQWTDVWETTETRRGLTNVGFTPSYQFFSDKDCLCSASLQGEIKTGGPTGAGTNDCRLLLLTCSQPKAWVTGLIAGGSVICRQYCCRLTPAIGLFSRDKPDISRKQSLLYRILPDI